MAITYIGQYRKQGAPPSAWASLFTSQSGLTFAWNTAALSAGTYDIQIQGHNSTGPVDSAWSATRSFTIQHVVVNTPPPPPPITSPTAGQSVDASLQVTLGQVSDPQGDVVLYRAERRLAGGTWIPLFGPGTAFSYLWDTSALPPGSYEVRAYAGDGLLESAASAVTAFTITHPPPVGTPAFLVLSTFPVEVDEQSAGEDEPLSPGAVGRGFGGRLLGSSWGTRRRRWHATTKPLTDLEYATFIGAVSTIGILSATGDMVRGAVVPVTLTIKGVTYLQQGGGQVRAIAFALEEV